ncbi:glycosyltransferase family 4 protein [Paraclostridium bifermentans]|uniref:glycosyltransferase family 4 protein n=1 Tax=Paraclostridium bifermentans TaxID=1490 RepID=UPI00038D4F15|nr:glycosyltransferase family 4 protein [Paraclostridium bifermentans]EQK45204.1 glycosyl transferases group 1 family protein [[Clostridium] bifermentans ATCC 19299] [Paraclostridium bifermentans ATCC 19299]MCE9675460.1 glycosyltransferase family 4 protein [Paraclostridium bifermentans]
MNILFLNMYPEYGGTEIYLERLIKNIKNDNFAKNIYLMSPKVEKFYENVSINLDKIFTVETPSFKNIKNIKNIGKHIDELIEELKIDCVYLNGLRAIILKPFIKSKFVKFIAVSHLSLINNQDVITRTRMLISNKILKRSLSEVNSIIVLSENHKKEMIKLKIADPKKIEVVYNGIDIDDYKLDADNNKNEKKIKIIEIARLHKTKGQIDLIDVICRLNKKYKNLEVNLIGDGIDRERIEEKIRKENLEDVVNVLGFRKNVKEIISESDIFILPSYIEGLPLSMLESMAMSLPVVVSSIAGIPEVIDNGNNGYLITPGNLDEIETALDNLIKNKKLRVKMGNQARKTVEEKFNDKICYEKTKRIILR